MANAIPAPGDITRRRGLVKGGTIALDTRTENSLLLVGFREAFYSRRVEASNQGSGPASEIGGVENGSREKRGVRSGGRSLANFLYLIHLLVGLSQDLVQGLAVMPL